MKYRLAACCVVAISVALGAAAWVALPPLFSILIILAVAYVDERILAALQAKRERLQQSDASGTVRVRSGD